MKLEQMKIKELLDTSHTIAEKLFEGHEYPWEVLGDINGFIESLGASLPENEYKKIGKNIWIHSTDGSYHCHGRTYDYRTKGSDTQRRFFKGKRYPWTARCHRQFL